MAAPASLSHVVARKLLAASGGNVRELTQAVYSELRRCAQNALRSERGDHTLQATELVHETFVRLVEQSQLQWEGNGHFLAIAAHVMRQILVDYARSRGSLKRGGDQQRVELEEGVACSPDPVPDEIVALDDALHRLAERDPRLARIVELRFFGGLTIEETAQVVDSSPRSVKRDWSLARAWLHREMKSARI